MPTDDQKDRTDAAEKRMEDLNIGPEDTRQSPAEGELARDENESQGEPVLDTTDSQLEPPPVPNIHVALSDVMREIGPIAKSERNKSQGYNYRGIDAICTAAYPLFVKHGVTLSAKIVGDVQRSERKTKAGGMLFYSVFTVRYTFWARDGTHRETEAVGEGMDSGDKSCNKAMSTAMRYAILQMLCIPVAMKDHDADKPYGAPAQAKNAPDVPPRGETPEEPVTGDRVMLLFHTWAEVVGHDLTTDEGKIDARDGFPPWVQHRTGREFNAKKSGEWRQADLKACEEALP